MSSKWEPSQYSDEYHEALEKMIEKKIESGGKVAPPPAKKKRATNVVDLMSVLQQSLHEKSSKTKSEKAAKKSRTKSRKKAA
jgi:DNA end-binding protein Ku